MGASSLPPLHLCINKIIARDEGWAGTLVWPSFGVAARAPNLYFWWSGYCASYSPDPKYTALLR